MQAYRIHQKHLQNKERTKRRYNEGGKATLFKKQKLPVPKEGHPISADCQDKGIVFYVPKEEEKFNPKDRRHLYDPLAVYKAGLLLDRVRGVERLTAPDRWCVLPKSETVTVEIPLTKYEHDEYKKEVVQELGHVAWHKAYFHVDKEEYEETQVKVDIKQVVRKVNSKSLPRWKPKNRYWDEDFIGGIEVPGTIFCTEGILIKKLKYWSGEKPDIVHQKDVSHTAVDTIGCSVLRRHQAPRWSYYPTVEEEAKTLDWNGLVDRNQWVYQSLYNIWTGEESVPGQEWRERVYWTGPARTHNRNEYFQCHYPPYCHVVEEVEEDAESEDDVQW